MPATRYEILDWLNGGVGADVEKLEDCKTGAVYCHIFDMIHPGALSMKKVNWGAKTEYDYIKNFKVLQAGFNAISCPQPIDVDKLMKGKFQDHLLFLQWYKTYYDHHCASDTSEASSHTASAPPKPSAPAPRRSPTPTRTSTPRRPGATPSPTTTTTTPRTTNTLVRRSSSSSNLGMPRKSPVHGTSTPPVRAPTSSPNTTPAKAAKPVVVAAAAPSQAELELRQQVAELQASMEKMQNVQIQPAPPVEEPTWHTDKMGVLRSNCTVDCCDCPKYVTPVNGHQCDYCGHLPPQHRRAPVPGNEAPPKPTVPAPVSPKTSHSPGYGTEEPAVELPDGLELDTSGDFIEVEDECVDAPRPEPQRKPSFSGILPKHFVPMASEEPQAEKVYKHQVSAPMLMRGLKPPAALP